MIDVIHLAIAVTDINQHADDINDVFLAQGTRTRGFIASQTTIELHPAHTGQVVAIK